MLISMDGKYLRGSKWEEMPALQAITVAAQRMGIVLRQTAMEGDALEAAIASLEAIPPGRVYGKGSASM